jgi:hypothetical protein
MSLINDALKQTKQSQPPNPPSHPPSLPPAESAPPEGGKWLVSVVFILLFAAAGTFVGLSLSKRTVPVAAATKTQSVAATLSKVTHSPAGSNTVAVVPAGPEPKLQGILLATAHPCAIVSGKTVYVGDQINEFRVAAISENSVTLQSARETKVLSLNLR